MSNMKKIMEGWKKYIVLKEQIPAPNTAGSNKPVEPIETYGQLRNQLDMAIKTKKKAALAGFGIGMVFDYLGGAIFKDAATFIKTMYKLPDDKKTGTVLDVFLNVNDEVSAIVDDELENAFLQKFIDRIQDKPDDEKITTSITQELQDWIAAEYSQNTVKK